MSILPKSSLLALGSSLLVLMQSSLVLAKNYSAAELFAKPKSFGSLAVGVAEGNYTIEGKATSLYSGHTDPGNHVTLFPLLHLLLRQFNSILLPLRKAKTIILNSGLLLCRNPSK